MRLNYGKTKLNKRARARSDLTAPSAQHAGTARTARTNNSCDVGPCGRVTRASQRQWHAPPGQNGRHGGSPRNDGMERKAVIASLSPTTAPEKPDLTACCCAVRFFVDGELYLIDEHYYVLFNSFQSSDSICIFNFRSQQIMPPLCHTISRTCRYTRA